MPEKRLSSNFEKVIKKNKVRIVSKPLAYLNSMVNTYVNFQKNLKKTVGRVVHTMYCPLTFIVKLPKNDFKLQKIKCVFETLCPQKV